MKTLVLCFAACLVVHAADIVTTDGKVYKNAKIVQHDAVNATILDDDGGATVPIAALSRDLQKQLGYDPAKAQASASQAAADDARARADAQHRAQLLAGKVYLDGTVIGKSPDGLKICCDGPGPVDQPDGMALAQAGVDPAKYYATMQGLADKQAAERGKPFSGTCLLRDADPSLAISDHVALTAYPDGESGGFHAFTARLP